MSLVDAAPRRLGPYEVGPLAFGCWRFTGTDVDAARNVVEAALDAGMNLVDTADVYGLESGGDGFGHAEELLGKVLADAPELRDRMVLATKGGIAPPIPYDSSAAYLQRAVDASLRRLQTERIDLYQIHRPDLLAHPGEVAAALDAVVAAGKVGAVGVSNYTASQTRALAAYLETPLVATQPEFSAAHLAPLRDGTFDVAMELGIVPLVWSPLGGGRLATGEGVRGGLVQTLDGLAEREGADRAAVALAFVLCHPSRPVAIIGSQNPTRISAAADALTVSLDRHDWYDVVEASTGESLP